MEHLILIPQILDLNQKLKLNQRSLVNLKYIKLLLQDRLLVVTQKTLNLTDLIAEKYMLSPGWPVLKEHLPIKNMILLVDLHFVLIKNVIPTTILLHHQPIMKLALAQKILIAQPLMMDQNNVAVKQQDQ